MSQRKILTLFLLSSDIVRLRKSTPIVEKAIFGKGVFVYLKIILVLPTQESPRVNIFIMKSFDIFTIDVIIYINNRKRR